MRSLGLLRPVLFSVPLAKAVSRAAFFAAAGLSAVFAAFCTGFAGLFTVLLLVVFWDGAAAFSGVLLFSFPAKINTSKCNSAK